MMCTYTNRGWYVDFFSLLNCYYTITILYTQIHRVKIKIHKYILSKVCTKTRSIRKEATKIHINLTVCEEKIQFNFMKRKEEYLSRSSVFILRTYMIMVQYHHQKKTQPHV